MCKRYARRRCDGSLYQTKVYILQYEVISGNRNVNWGKAVL